MGQLTADRDWVYSAQVAGRFQRLHRATGRLLIVFLFALPWMRIRGLPALELDLGTRTLYAFGGIFRPTDTILLVLLGLVLALGLFLFTALYGRLWCGYACPQTVFLEEWVRRLELRIEGDRGKRRARDQGPWTWDKAWRKGLKWSLFLLAAGGLSMTLVSLFTGAPDLWTGRVGSAAWLWVASLTALWFADFVWFREQLCNYVCPYARFQGALTDDQSLVVHYDLRTGEPRKEKGEPYLEGSCIDCKKCVAVCPQGIDIRKGYQLECVNCARCVDACEGVMGRLGHDPLIRYTTLADEQGRERRVLRGRTLVYSGLVAVLGVAFLWQLQARQDLEVTVNRAPGSLFTVDADGAVRNTFLVRVTDTSNRADRSPEPLTVTVSGLPGAEVLVPELSLAPDTATTLPLVIRATPEAVPHRTTSLVVTVSTGGETVHRTTTFKSPAAMGGES